MEKYSLKASSPLKNIFKEFKTKFGSVWDQHLSYQPHAGELDKMSCTFLFVLFWSRNTDFLYFIRW